MNFKRNPLTSRLFVIISSAVFWGILAHGMAFFHKFSYHDDTSAFNGVGVSYPAGRWMLALMAGFVRKATGGRLYSLPIVNGLFTILCIALMLYLVYTMTDLRDPVMCFLVTGIFVTFPAITSVFGYMFTAPYYYFGMLCGVAGVCVFYRKKTILSLLACIALMCCSIGTYQINISACVCVMLLISLQNTLHSQYRPHDLVKTAAGVLLPAAGSLAAYLAVNRLFLNLKGIEMVSDRRNISGMGMTGISGYLGRIAAAYREFFYPTADCDENMFPYTARYLHQILIAVCLILAVWLLVKVYKENVLKGLTLTVLMAVYPLGAYLVFVMVDRNIIHSVMVFAEAFPFLLAVWLFENTVSGSKAAAWLKKGGLILTALLLFMNIRLAGLCYMKADILQSQAIGYYNSLASRIRCVKEYTDETPVVYINEDKKEDNSYTGADSWVDSIRILPYGFSSIVNNYEWKKNMALWTGFKPPVSSSEPYEDSEIVAAMPCYPDDGSIKYMDGCIVVKFSD